jgi:hypothetical protein
MSLTLYDEPLESADDRIISPAEDERLSDIRAVEALRAQPGWPKLTAHLQGCRESLLQDLTYAENPIEISRLQGAVHALNLFFGTTESLFTEGAFLRDLSKNQGPAKAGQPKE